MLFSLLALQILLGKPSNSHTNSLLRTSTHNPLESYLIMSSLLLFLLLCLSMDACNARQLGIIPKDPCRQVYLFREDVEETELHESSSILSRPRPSISEDERKTHESWSSTKMMKQKVSKALISKEEEETKETTSGSSARSEIIVSSSKEGPQQQATQVEGWKRQARALLGSVPRDADETLDSKEHDTVEDIVVMDYAQPHRKPPIHNEDP